MLENLVIPDKENPLLRLRADQKTTFSHDKDREIAAVRYFAEEINSGRMSVKGAYKHFGSDIFLFGPDTILVNLYQILEPKKAEELAKGYYERCENHGLEPFPQL